MCEQVRRDGAIAALKSIGRVVVAAAHVRVNDKVIGLALDCGVVERHAQLAHLLQVNRAHTGLRHKVGIAIDAPGAVIKLNVAAACGIQVGNNGAVCCGDGIGEIFVGLVDGAQALLLAIAAVERDFGERLDRRRNGLSRDLTLPLERLDKFEVLDERMILGPVTTAVSAVVSSSWNI